jgi:hypothetical protein
MTLLFALVCQVFQHVLAEFAAAGERHRCCVLAPRSSRISCCHRKRLRPWKWRQAGVAAVQKEPSGTFPVSVFFIVGHELQGSPGKEDPGFGKVSLKGIKADRRQTTS